MRYNEYDTWQDSEENPKRAGSLFARVVVHMACDAENERTFSKDL
jgi:hypothetical protein